MFTSVLRADFKRVRFMRLGLVCAAFYLATMLVYVFAPTGSWVSMHAPDGTGWWGFLPDPTFDLVFTEYGYPLAKAIASAAVAHTVFFPLLALALVHQLYFTDVRDSSAQVSLAHGISRFQFFCSKLVVASVVLQGCYLVFSFAAAAVYVAVYQPESMLLAFETLGGKVLLNCLVNESFIVFCMAVFSWVDHSSTAAGIVFVVTLVGLVAQMAFGNIEVPAHMGYWMKVSGFDGSSAIPLTTALFSLGSFVLFAGVAFGGSLRARKAVDRG